MVDNPLQGFPVTLRWPVAWGDMDALQHVNNVAYFRWFESVRMCYFEELGWTGGPGVAGVGPILAHATCTYRAPLTYPDTVHLGARATDVQADRFTMRYLAVSERLGGVAAEGEGRIVAFDYTAGRKATLPDTVREAIVRLEGDQ